MLVRHRARRRDARQGGDRSRASSAPDIINSVQVHAAAAGDAGGALRRSLAPGGPRPRRAVEHVRQPHARQYRHQTASQLPITTPGGSFQSPASTVGGATSDRQLPISPVVAAGVLSTVAPPFGFLVSRLIGGSSPLDVLINALEQKRPRAPSRRAQPRRAVGRHRELPGRRRVSRSRCPARSARSPIDYKKYGVGLAFTPTVLERRRDQPQDRARGQPARLRPYRARSARHHRSRR